MHGALCMSHESERFLQPILFCERPRCIAPCISQISGAGARLQQQYCTLLMCFVTSHVECRNLLGRLMIDGRTRLEQFPGDLIEMV